MRRLLPNNIFIAPKMPNPNKDLVRLVVAEAPGQDETVTGEPLTGGAGRWFNSILEKAHIDREGLTLANCIQCRPPDNIFPTDPAARKYISKEDANEAVKHCAKSHLNPLLRSRNWKRVDLLGDKPLKLVAGKNEGVFKWRGSPLDIVGDGYKLRGLATLHPAYIMRDQVYFPVAINDMMKSLDEPEEHYLPYPSIEDVQKFTATTFAFDIECPKYKFLGDDAPPELVGLCARVGYGMCVPVRGAYVPELRRIFVNAKHLIAHNGIQFDIAKLFPVLGIEWKPE